MAIPSKESLAMGDNLEPKSTNRGVLACPVFQEWGTQAILSSVIGWEELVGSVASSQRSDGFQSGSWAFGQFSL